MSTPRPPFESASKQQSEVASAAADETAGLPGDPASGTPGSEFLAPPQKPGEIGRLAHYRLLRQLGAGGMGKVFEAEDTTLDRLVALKVMHGSMAANATAKERFIREAKAAAAVKHDHIVSIYQVGEDRGVPFIALEFLQGQPLDAWLKKNPKATVVQMLRIGREMADGLAAAHGRGLIHRDIKPANVWLEAPKGRVKILDFGLARAANDDAQLTREGAVVGTPAYMSPEQARGESLDARTDLFSLGVMFYRMLTGVQPFTGSSTLAVLMSLGVDNPAPVREKNPEVPESLSNLVMRLLSKDRDGRPKSAAEVSKELQAIAKEVTRGTAKSGPMPVVAAVPAATTANPWEDIDASSGSRTLPTPLIGGVPQGHFASVDVTAVSQEQGEAAPPKSKKKLLIGAGLLAVLVLVAVGVIIKVTGPDGKETTLHVPDGSKVKVDPKGNVAVTLPKPLPVRPLTTTPADLAVQFDGTNRVEIPTLKLPPQGPYTMEGYFGSKPGTSAANSVVLGILDQSHLEFSGKDNWRWEWKDQVKKKEQGVLATIPVELPVDHIACVNDGKECRLYRNGVLMGSRLLEKPSAGAGLFMIGDRFSGTANEVRVSKTARYAADFKPAARLESDADTLALYHCDEGDGDLLRDSSGNNHHGKITSATWVPSPGPSAAPVPALTSLPVDYALQFNGNSSRVEVPTLAWDGKLPITIEARVNYKLMPYPRMICKLVNIGSVHLHVEDKAGWFANISNGSGPTTTMLSAGKPAPSGTHDLALVIGDKRIRMFEDGKLIREMKFGWTAYTTQMTQSAGIGAEYDPAGMRWISLFAGTIDELRISRALRYDKDYTPARRLATDGDTLALYHFDEGNGDVLTDSSGNNHHGKIVGAKWVKAEGTATSPPAFFNGKDLTGWSGDPSFWQVLNGELVAGKDPAAKSGSLVSEKEYGDFELSFQLRRSLSGNSPPAFTFGKAPNAPGVTVHFTGDKLGNKIELRGPPDFDKAQIVPLKRDDFNDVTIRCVGQAVKVVANGVTLADVELAAPLRGRLSWSPGRDDMGGHLTVRNIRFTHLSQQASAPPATGPRWPLAPSKPEDMAWLQTLKATLTLRSGPGTEADVKPTDPLPSGPATIVGVKFNYGESGPVVTDEVIARVASLIDLESLGCSFSKPSPVTKDGLKPLSALVQLRSLALGRIGTAETDPSFLAGFTKLESLNLGNVAYLDWEVHVARLSMLRDISLYSLDNANLEKLGPLPRLQRVDLGGYGTGRAKRDAAAKRLAAVVPWCRILIRDTKIEENVSVIEPTAPLPGEAAAPPPAKPANDSDAMATGKWDGRGV